jgi:hypothetical protein
MKTIVKTTQMVTMCLNGKDLSKLLNLPDNATNIQIAVRVPGGGDWSNTDLDLMQENIIVQYQLHTSSK